MRIKKITVFTRRYSSRFLPPKRRKYLKISDKIGDHCLVIDSFVDHINGQELVVQGLRISGVMYEKIQIFHRLLKDGLLYVAESYSRDLTTRSSFVSHHLNNEKNFGSIFSFAKMKICHCENNKCESRYYAILKEIIKIVSFNVFHNQERHIPLLYMHQFEVNVKVFAIPVRSYICLLLYTY